MCTNRGGDEDGIVASVCVACHLELVPCGRLVAEPPAGHIRWILGRSPVLEVAGREKVAAA